jgi:pimeloyl-ACP methyl ester carboxylesterase
MNPTITAQTLDVPGARLHYELRGTGPLVVLIGAPMHAESFAPLADLLAADYTVLTTDPRGINRSPVDDPDQDSTPEMRADDLARLITHVDAGPAAVFGSSGGAITSIALLQAHPELVTVVIAHEPPLIELLDDRAEVRAATEDYCETFLRGDRVGAWRKFLATANIHMPEPVFMQVFGNEPEPQQAADERHWFANELRAGVFWQPDIAALRALAAHLVVGIGEDSGEQECERTSNALAAAVDIAPVRFPGGHTGFADDPAAFLPRLREVLTHNA